LDCEALRASIVDSLSKQPGPPEAPANMSQVGHMVMIQTVLHHADGNVRKLMEAVSEIREQLYQQQIQD